MRSILDLIRKAMTQRGDDGLTTKERQAMADRWQEREGGRRLATIQHAVVCTCSSPHAAIVGQPQPCIAHARLYNVTTSSAIKIGAS